MNDVEYIQYIINEWKQRENYTRQIFFTDEPVLYFDDEIQEKYGLVCYYTKFSFLSPTGSGQAYYDTYFYVNLSYFSENNSINDELEYLYNAHIIVVDGGKIPDTLFIHYKHERDKALVNKLYDITFNTKIENVTVYMHHIQPNLPMENCNLNFLYLREGDVENLKSLLTCNKVTVDTEIYY
jgi:hypothetical protein